MTITWDFDWPNPLTFNQTLWDFTDTLRIFRIFLKICEILSRNTVLSCPFFSNFSWKTPCSHAHDWSKKRKFCQNYTIYGPKKSTERPFFSDFSRKNHWFMSFFSSFLWKPPAVKPIYGQKNVKSVKITLFWARKDNRMPFFSDFSRKNNCSNLYCTYFLKKSSIL